MKNKNKIIMALIAVGSLVIILVSFYISWIINSLKEENVKLELKNIDLEEEVNASSDIEILEKRIKLHRLDSEDSLEIISQYELLIKEEQGYYESAILSKVCEETQLNRKLNWLEYNMEYCLNESNLEQYRTKK